MHISYLILNVLLLLVVVGSSIAAGMCWASFHLIFVTLPEVLQTVYLHYLYVSHSLSCSVKLVS